MDWMYQGVSGIVDREDYLTGRKIDKTFELLEKEQNPESRKDDDDGMLLFQNHLSASGSSGEPPMSQSDLAAKMREDPLYEIKMKQMEERKKLLTNPMQLKKLKEALKASLEKDSNKKHKKRKSKKNKKESKKKSKKKRHSSDDSDDDSSSSDSDSDDDRRHHHRHKRSRRSPEKPSKSESTRHRHRDDRPEKPTESHRSRPERHRQPHRSSSTTKRGSTLTEEELERRRKEMMSNAEWREQTRKDHVQRLNEREREEEKRDKEKSSGSGFIKPMLTGMAEKISVEESVKRKRFQLQRGTDTMDRNFARKY